MNGSEDGSVTCTRGRFVIKGASPVNHHIGREITAYQRFTDCVARSGHAPVLFRQDRSANVLVIRYITGSLVMGTDSEFDPEIYRQAGELSRVFHGQAERVDPEWDATAVAKSLMWLENPHRIQAVNARRLRSILTHRVPKPVVVVPTHGDWQPRNWLIDDGTVRIIDFGRFGWRPAASDFRRLAVQQWKLDPRLEDAFFSGYRSDPRTPDQWRMLAVHEAIGTAVWAYQVGDELFEEQGHRMIAEALQVF